ncbi:MAG: hypothetical protein FWC77_01675 [Defluviitaleaceae bacterium]|nr:hypothetical protein [Defluviitaleaceae bacterium]
MPYDNRQQMQQDMKQGEKPFHSVEDCVNHLVTDFKMWEEWNGVAMVCASLHNHRGPGRWHMEMAAKAFCDGKHFRKMLADKPFAIPTMVDYNCVTKHLDSAHYTEEKTLWHFDVWCKMLYDSRELFNDAVYYLSECKELTLYQKVACYLTHIENQIMYVDIVKDRITPTALNHPDAYRVFEQLHVYFESHYDPTKRIDFDV